MANKALPIAVGAAVVAGGGAAAYFFLNQGSGPIGGGESAAGVIASAEVVPDEAFAVAYISLETGAWDKLKEFGTPEAQQLLTDGMQEFQQGFEEGFSDSGFSYTEDIEPWAKSMMVSVLPPADETATEPGFLLVVGIKDQAAFDTFAQAAKAKDGVESKDSDYNGVTISETIADGGEPSYTALLGSQLVVAPDEATVQLAIDASKGESLAATQKDALNADIGVENPIAQVYITNYKGLIEEAAASGGAADLSAFPPGTLEQLDQVESISMGLGIDDEGIRLKTQTVVAEGAGYKFEPSPGQVVSKFPSETVLLVTGKGISEIWSAVVEQSADVPEVNEVIEQIRQSTQLVGLDADTEIFGWMDGEYAIGAIASSEGLLAQTGFGGAVIFETSDRATADGMFETLDSLVGVQGLQVTDQDVGGVSMKAWEVPGQGAFVSRGWVNDNFLVLTIGAPITNMMIPQPGSPLSDSDTFKGVTSSLPDSNIGYFYLDMAKVTDILKGPAFQFQIGQIPPDADAILSSIEGVGVTATQSSDTMAELEFLLALKPAQ